MYNPEKPTTLGTLDTARRHDRSLSGDVRVSIYCDHHVQLTLFCICMNLNTFCIWTCYIICHSCCNAWPSLSKWFMWGLVKFVTKMFYLVQIRWLWGHDNTLMLFWVRKSTLSIGIWGQDYPADASSSVGQLPCMCDCKISSLTLSR